MYSRRLHDRSVEGVWVDDMCKGVATRSIEDENTVALFALDKSEDMGAYNSAEPFSNIHWMAVVAHFDLA